MVFVVRDCIIMHNMIVEDCHNDYESGHKNLQYLEDACRIFRGGKEFLCEAEHCTAVLMG